MEISLLHVCAGNCLGLIEMKSCQSTLPTACHNRIDIHCFVLPNNIYASTIIWLRLTTATACATVAVCIERLCMLKFTWKIVACFTAINWNYFTFQLLLVAINALTVMVEWHEKHPSCKKLSGGVLEWLFVWDKVQICIFPSWCHCHLLSCTSKSNLVSLSGTGLPG